MKKTKLTFYAALLAVGMTMFGSCSAPKNVAYFQDFDEVTRIEMQSRQSITVKPDDKLQIVVTSKDPQLASLFNLPVVTSRLGQNANTYGGTATNFSGNQSSSEGLSSYTVSPEGNIEFPVLGELHVAGMTRSELAGFIKGELLGRNLIKDPTVIVEFLNTGISVLGEVKAPGRYVMNRDQISILDAIAVAGDLDINGRRDNVKVMRKEGNTTKVYTIDLTNGESVFKSPAYYLQQDDIVYVEPSDLRKRQTTVNGTTPFQASFWISVVSVLTSVAVLVVNLVNK